MDAIFDCLGIPVGVLAIVGLVATVGFGSLFLVAIFCSILEGIGVRIKKWAAEDCMYQMGGLSARLRELEKKKKKGAKT